MKKLILFLILSFVFLACDSEKQNAKVSFRKEIDKINNSSGIDDQVSFWKAHAYVNLNLMKFKINKILTNKN